MRSGKEAGFLERKFQLTRCFAAGLACQPEETFFDNRYVKVLTLAASRASRGLCTKTFRLEWEIKEHTPYLAHEQRGYCSILTIHVLSAVVNISRAHRVTEVVVCVVLYLCTRLYKVIFLVAMRRPMFSLISFA